MVRNFSHLWTRGKYLFLIDVVIGNGSLWAGVVYANRPPCASSHALVSEEGESVSIALPQDFDLAQKVILFNQEFEIHGISSSN